MKHVNKNHIKSFLKHIYYLLRLYAGRIISFLDYISQIILLFACLGGLTLLIYQFGFYTESTGIDWFKILRPYILYMFFFGILLRYVARFKDLYKAKFFVVDMILFLLVPLLLYLLKNYEYILNSPDEYAGKYHVVRFLMHRYFSYALLLTLTLIHISQMLFSFLRRKIKPSLLFILSFLIFVFVGTGLLLLPNMTYNGVSLIDAIFTSTTSVCVTGLTTVNIAQTFTIQGQIIILLLIQVGGIGVITFTSFFALSFMGNASVGSQMVLKDMFNEKKIGDLLKVLISILFVTFILEAVGAYLIYGSIEGSMPTKAQDIYVSVFHSISAYCNAGISPLPNNLGSEGFLENHIMHLYISCLIILGGIGFPIVLNYMRLLKHIFSNVIKYITGKQIRYVHIPRIIQLHTYLTIATTVILIVGGTLIFYLLERNNTLQGLNIGAQFIESLFYATTPRTAGFSTYATSALSSPAILITIILMFIGASPMSTGGGIKTTTMAVAFLTAVHMIRGKKEVEVRGRKLTATIIRHAFTIVILFFAYVIVVSVIICSIEPGVDITAIVFEVVSATATVGSSMGITEDLCTASKVMLIVSMFIGRIGILTFFMGVTPEAEKKRYNYINENVLLT